MGKLSSVETLKINGVKPMFFGGKDDKVSVLYQLLSPMDGWKRYSLNISNPGITAKEFMLSFPMIEINETTIDPVKVRFDLVEDGKVCHTSV